jgi:hypothetical protein
MMLVDNHKNQLSEAFRVLKKGSKCGFTLWGRKENTNMFTIVGDVLMRMNIGSKELPKKTNFTLGEDLNKIKQDFEQAGFTNVKAWY